MMMIMVSMGTPQAEQNCLKQLCNTHVKPRRDDVPRQDAPPHLLTGMLTQRANLSFDL